MAAITNLAPIADFRLGLLGSAPSGWALVRASAVTTQINATTVGSRLTITSATSIIGVKPTQAYRAAVSPDSTYTISWRVTNESTGSRGYAQVVFWYTADNVFLSQESSPTLMFEAGSSGDHVFTATSPAGAGRLGYEFYQAPTDASVGETFLLWPMQVQAGNVATTPRIPQYDDTGTLLPGYTWTGTPHASTSVLTLPDASPRVLHPVLKIGSSHIGPQRVGERT